MKRILLYILFIPMVLLPLKSCETTERIDNFPFREPKLVANCYFLIDSTWAIQVSESLPILDNGQLRYIENAKIYIYHEDNLMDSISNPDSDGIYRSAFGTPVSGGKYAIEVRSPDYTKALYAEDIMPEQVDISYVNLMIIDSSFYRDPNYNEVWGNVKGRFNINFKDPADQENYYELSVYSYDEFYDYYDSTLYVNRYKLDFTSDDPLVETSSDYNTTLFFTDELINGQNYKLELDFEDWNVHGNSKYEIELVCLSRAAYLYRRSIHEYNQSSGDPFSEPVVIYSNIENGFGIFAGYCISKHLVSLF